MEANLPENVVSAEKRDRNRSRAAFVATAAVAWLAGYFLTGAWQSDLAVPFKYDHDGLMAVLPIKTMVEQGWWYTDDRLGAPLRMDWYDFPVNPNVHFAILKLMSAFTSNPFRLANQYVLLGFPLVAVCALAALRTMRLPLLASVFGSLIFAFAPYHFWRGLGHIWLGVYFTVPLGMILIAWVLQDRRGLLLDAGEGGRWKLSLRTWPTLAALLCCAALGFDFPYYPVFICFLLLVAGAYAAVRLNSWRPAFRSGALIGAVAACFVINLLPNLLYRLEHGPSGASMAAAVRPWNHAERYGLKIASLLMPPLFHPIPALEAVREEYQAGTTVLSSADSMSLGTIAACGFLSLLGWTVFRLHRGAGADPELMDGICVLNLACLLLATVGGFGSVLNMLFTSVLRCYDRISIVIMFLSLVPVCLLIAAIGRRLHGRVWTHAAYIGMVGLLLGAGMWEQSRFFRLLSPAQLDAFRSDRAFVKAIEDQVGADAAVFQYPVQNFLSQEGPAISTDPYTHFRGFLHSKTLTWSMGAVVGRKGAAIQNWIASRPTPYAVNAMCVLGFDGIYLDRAILPPGSESLEQELVSITGAPPLVSRDGRMAFIPLTGYAASLRERLTPEQWQLAREQVLQPVIVELVGFYGEEKYPTERFAWCRADRGRLRIVHSRPEPITLELAFTALTALDDPATLAVEGPGLKERHAIGPIPVPPFRHRVVLPAGENFIEFRCDAKPLVLPQRNVTFRLKDLSFSVEEESRVALNGDEQLR